MLSPGETPLVNDYSLCCQKVTVYHEEGGEVTRTVWPRAYLERTRAQEVGSTGSSERSGFLLVIPGDVPVSVGDKVCDGEGPDVPSADQMAWWRSLIPTKVPGIAVVRNVSRRYWRGEVAHVEAGG